MLLSTMTMERSASDLAAISGLSRPAASQHLATLLEAGLLTVRAEGRHRWYRSNPDALDRLHHDLDVFWSGRLEALKRAAES